MNNNIVVDHEMEPSSFLPKRIQERLLGYTAYLFQCFHYSFAFALS